MNWYEISIRTGSKHFIISDDCGKLTWKTKEEAISVVEQKKRFFINDYYVHKVSSQKKT